MIPRKNEVDAVVAVITATDDDGEPLYDDEQAMAKQIVKAVAAELDARERYAIVPAGAGFGYGPYWTATEAARAWRKRVGASFEGGAALLRVFPWPPDEIGGSRAGVCECGHGPEQHVTKAQRGGKPGAPKECGACAASVKKGATNECQNYRRTA